MPLREFLRDRSKLIYCRTQLIDDLACDLSWTSHSNLDAAIRPQNVDIEVTVCQLRITHRPEPFCSPPLPPWLSLAVALHEVLKVYTQQRALSSREMAA